MKYTNIEKEYFEHKLFEELSSYSQFYKSLSFSIFRWIPLGTNAIINIDSSAYSSIHGTVESIKELLNKGRINDSYALLRKYYDSTIINVYSNLYLDDHFKIENFIVTQIENWRKGTESIPEYRIISNYIKNSEKLKPITDLLQKDKSYKEIRDRCNAHTHYNFYSHLLLNDSQIYLPNRLKYLDIFSDDIKNIFIQHFSYLFYLRDHYMMSSDYMDCIDCGMTPDENLQYEVAPFIQDIFSDLVEIKRPDIATKIKLKTTMKLR